MILDHLYSLTKHITGDVYGVAIYAENGHISDAPNEGLYCVDDVARAILLALDYYEEFKIKDEPGAEKALMYALRWSTFLEYCWTDKGLTNFVFPDGSLNLSGKTSYPNGDWWTVRARWALKRLIRVVGTIDGEKRIPQWESMLSSIDKIWFPNGAGQKIHAVYILSQLENNPKILPSLPDLSFNGKWFDFDHEMWGYHQLYAGAKLVRYDDRCPDYLRKTVDNLVEPVIEMKMCYALEDKFRAGICSYCVSSLVQGLAEMSRLDNYSDSEQKTYAELAISASNWLYGDNDRHEVLYFPETGICYDGLSREAVNKNAGAESSIEAGFIWLEIERIKNEQA